MNNYPSGSTDSEPVGSPEKKPSYSDAVFSRPAETASTGSYGYNPSRCYSSGNVAAPKEPEKKNPKRLPFGAVVALCLVCAMLGGLCGFGGALLGARRLAAAENAEPYVPVSPAPEQSVPEAGFTASFDAQPGKTIKSGDASAPGEAGAERSGAVLTAEELYASSCRQVVGINTEINGRNVFGQAVSSSVSGSGFFLSADGYVLTNYHVVEDAYISRGSVTVFTYDGQEYPAEIIGVESDCDLAVLKINETGTDAAAFGRSADMIVGQSVYTIGNPLGELSYSMTGGIVSALDRSITTDTNVTVSMFQIDAAVNSGNSGGPVYNRSGQVIGVVTAKYSSAGVEGLGFAIPADTARRIAEELIENGYVTGKASLGASLTTVSASAAQYYGMVEGVFVNSVTAGGCADRAGIRSGDVITAFDGTETLSVSDVSAALKTYSAGDSVRITLYRDGGFLTVDAVFDEEVPSIPEDTSEDIPYRYYDYYPSDPGGLMEEFFNFFYGGRSD